MRRVLLALVLAACAEGAGPGTAIDARVRPDASEDAAVPGTPDAAPVVDAAPGTPDARPAIDASPGTPDARPVDAAVVIDARPVDAAVVIDAHPIDAYSAPDAGCVTRTWQPLLTNGNFDSGDTAWLPSGSIFTYSSSGGLAYPNSGTYFAYLCGFNNCSESLYQDVVVPASATSLRLSGVRALFTEETVGGYDKTVVALTTTGGSVLETLDTWWDVADESSSWASFSLTAASAHAGSTVRLRFSATTDVSSISTFLLDTLVLEAYACP